MGNSTQGQAQNPAPIEEVPKKDEEPAPEAYTGTFSLTNIKRLHSKNSCHWCFDVLFVILSILAVIKALAEIVVTVSTAIATKLYSSEQSGRLVGMILLALLAAVTISMLVYATTAVFKKHAKPLHATVLVLMITAAVQAVVLATVVRVNERDVQMLARSLQESFKLARDENPRHVLIWTATQSELKCCGLYGPGDYEVVLMSQKLPFNWPDVPISCCPAYDPDRSEIVQERAREACKAKRLYYGDGCSEQIIEGFFNSSRIVVGLTVSLIIIEVTLAILAAILQKKIKRNKSLKSEKAPEHA